MEARFLRVCERRNSRRSPGQRIARAARITKRHAQQKRFRARLLHHVCLNAKLAHLSAIEKSLQSRAHGLLCCDRCIAARVVERSPVDAVARIAKRVALLRAQAPKHALREGCPERPGRRDSSKTASPVSGSICRENAYGRRPSAPVPNATAPAPGPADVPLPPEETYQV